MDNNYENIKLGLGGGLIASDAAGGGAAVSRVLCDKVMTVDVGRDYSLPENMPEIRKLIRVDVRPSEITKYISGSGVQISGGIEYSAVYVGGDGEIYCAAFPDEFSISVPFDGNASSDKISVSAWARPESAVSRVNGSSGINIKCRLSVKTLALCTEKCDGGASLQTEAHVRRLVKKCPLCTEVRGTKNDMELTCSVDTSDDGTRYLSSDCKVFVTDAVTGDGYVDCRGYAYVKHLMTRGGELWTVSDKIPFSETVELDGVSSGAAASVFGACVDISAITSDLDVDADEKKELVIRLNLWATALVSSTLEYVKDMYSTVYEQEVKYEKMTLPCRVVCKNGNMTFSGREALPEMGIENDGISIIDVSGSAKAETLEREEDGYVIKGKCRFTLVYVGGGVDEPSYCECEMPFRFEFEGDGDGATRYEALVSVIDPKTRVDGDNAVFDCELAVSMCALCEREIAVASFVGGGRTERAKRRGFTVCYPENGESLWSVAKRYGAPLEDAAKENGMEGFGDSDEVFLIEGIKYMII